MHFGQWMKASRVDQKMTQAECAGRAHMTVSGWSNMERLTVSPKAETVRKVAVALDMSYEDVMAGAGLPGSRLTPSQKLTDFVERQAEKIAPPDRERFVSMAMGAIGGLASSFASAA